MDEIVGVTFTKNGRITYYYTNGFKLKKGINVLVEFNQGLRFAKVATTIHQIDETKLDKPLLKIKKIATKRDYYNHTNNLKDAKIALKKCNYLAKKYQLKMHIMDAYYTLDRDQLVFQFYAENRIDFRELARELASIYKTRIELRQIGVRDKAKEVGGIGMCGQKLCCSRFLKDFDSVSIAMAKNQNLALSPNKINGICGRLLCCLKYEDESYKENLKRLPKIGSIVEVKETGEEGKVVSTNILELKVKVKFGEDKEEERFEIYDLDNIKWNNKSKKE